MVVQHFLRWIDTAKVAERSAAAHALARVYLQTDLAFEDRCAAEAALTLLLDDPSEKVRAAMAEVFSMSPAAPRQIVEALAGDQPEVAGSILVRSPLLSDADLIDRIAQGDPRSQRLIAMRARLSVAVSAAIAEIGEEDACRELLGNSGAEIAGLSFRRLAERFGDVASFRELLLPDPRLPADSRHTLLVKVGDALRASPFVASWIGPRRAETLTKNACARASIALIDGTRDDEMPALVEHLRIRGDITPAFIVRAVAHGKIDFLGAVLVSLAGQPLERVRGLLQSGRDIALVALFRAAGFGEALHGVILRALKIWRDVAAGKRIAGPQEVSWMMLLYLEGEKEVGEDSAARDLALLIKSIHLDVLRDNARGHALAIAAA